MTMRRLIALTVLCGFAAIGDAQEIHGPYVGVSAGDFSFEQNDQTPIGIPFSDSSSAYRLFGGYQLNSAYAIEAGWSKTSDFTKSFTGFDPTLGAQSLDVMARYRIATLRVIAFAPFSSINMFGGVGYYDAKLDVDASYRDATQVITAADREDDGGATVVGGIQFNLRRLDVRGEYEWFHAKRNLKASSINVGVVFMF